MMTKVFAEDEARALFRSQEIDKLNNEMFQVGMAIIEKEISGHQETAEAVPSPTTSDEWTKVPEVQRNAKGWAFDPLRYADPWNQTVDGKGIKTCAVDFGQGSFPEQNKGQQWFDHPSGYYGQPAESPTGCGKGQGWAPNKGAQWSEAPMTNEYGKGQWIDHEPEDPWIPGRKGDKGQGC